MIAKFMTMNRRWRWFASSSWLPRSLWLSSSLRVSRGLIGHFSGSGSTSVELRDRRSDRSELNWFLFFILSSNFLSTPMWHTLTMLFRFSPILQCCWGGGGCGKLWFIMKPNCVATWWPTKVEFHVVVESSYLLEYPLDTKVVFAQRKQPE